MWRQAKITVGDLTADQAMVDFAPGRHGLPEVLEWPTALPLNAEITIGENVYFANDAQACGGKFHTPLMTEPLPPPREDIEDFEPRLGSAEAAIAEQEGKKP